MSHEFREGLSCFKALARGLAIATLLATLTTVSLPISASAQDEDLAAQLGAGSRSNSDLKSSTPGTAVIDPRSLPPALGAGIYKLGRGDKLRVRVYDREDLSWDVMVREDGNVQIPYLGKFEVTGRTTGDFEELIASALRKRLDRETSIAVDLLERRPFFIVGVVSKPGSYQFQPGMMVLHAVAIAGGVVRSETGSFLAADASRETVKLQTTGEGLKRLLAVRARLAAERKGQNSVATSPELVEIAGETEAKRLLAAEGEVLKTALEKIERDRLALASSIELSDKEISALELQIEQIKVQRKLRDKQLEEVQGMIAKGLTTQQRFVESQLAISLLERDTLEASANIARAKQARQKALRDIDMLTLERKTVVEQEIVKTDEQIDKAKFEVRASKKIIQQITGLPASMQMPLGGDPVLSYRIMRQTPDGSIQSMEADEQTAIEPGDILKVAPQRNQISTGSNR